MRLRLLLTPCRKSRCRQATLLPSTGRRAVACSTSPRRAGQWGFAPACYNDYRDMRHQDEQLSLGRTFIMKEHVTLAVVHAGQGCQRVHDLRIRLHQHGDHSIEFHLGHVQPALRTTRHAVAVLIWSDLSSPRDHPGVNLEATSQAGERPRG